MKNLERILNLIKAHNRYMESRIDLIASNSWISQMTRLALSSSLSNNYCIGFPGNRAYGGCAYIDMIEREVGLLLRELFHMQDCTVQFLSGMQANIGAYNAILKPGDTIIAADPPHGGHYSHTPNGPLRFFDPKIIALPCDETHYNIDLNRLEDTFKQHHPKLLILGWSEFLFPYPLEAAYRLCQEHDVTLMYDMSHVVGLIAGKQFQTDLEGHVDILTSSTGKSLHAPDHGIVMWNNDMFREGVHDAIMPLLTSNTHPHEVAGLGMALTEMQSFGEDYAKQVVKNTKALGASLTEHGIKALYAEDGYSESHTLLVEHPESEAAVHVLDQAGIFCNACPLPWDKPGEQTGIRLGTQVVTRRGFRESDMQHIGEAIAGVVLHGKRPDELYHIFSRPLAKRHRQATFSFDSQFPGRDEWTKRLFARIKEDNIGEIIRAESVFMYCSQDEIDSIAPHFDMVNYERDTHIYHTGDDADAVYFIYVGEVNVVEREGTHEKVIMHLIEGDHVGEYATLTGKPHMHDAVAKAGTRLVRIQKDEFLELIEQFEHVKKYFDDYLSSVVTIIDNTDYKKAA